MRRQVNCREFREKGALETIYERFMDSQAHEQKQKCQKRAIKILRSYSNLQSERSTANESFTFGAFTRRSDAFLISFFQTEAFFFLKREKRAINLSKICYFYL